MLLTMAQVTSVPFGTLPDGTPVTAFSVGPARFIDYGARLVSLEMPDRSGTPGPVVLGFATLAQYIADTSYQGATIGRVGNRTAAGKFQLDGVTYQVPQNNGENALHGGPQGFDRKLWTGRAIDDGVEFTLISPAGDQGFPGTLTVVVRYILTADSLQIDYTATTDAPTVINLTNHTYFNLAGTGTVLHHEIRIPAEAFTPVDATLIPTGELRPVEGTVFDLRDWTPIGKSIDAEESQLERAGGYDHNWVFGQPGVLKKTAELRESTSGRTLTVETTEPGMQFYAGNFLTGANGFPRRTGLCLETQHYPDSPNQPDFPSTVLRPGQTFHSVTVYRFGAA
jgi:aldose 1-epimerase